MPNDRDWRWREADHGEDLLWVCQTCGAECNADYVSDKCPACDDTVEDENGAAP